MSDAATPSAATSTEPARAPAPSGAIVTPTERGSPIVIEFGKALAERAELKNRSGGR